MSGRRCVRVYEVMGCIHLWASNMGHEFIQAHQQLYINKLFKVCFVRVFIFFNKT